MVICIWASLYERQSTINMNVVQERNNANIHTVHTLYWLALYTVVQQRN